MATKRPMLNGIVNRIQFIGVELEGGWDNPPAKTQIEHDASVTWDGRDVGQPAPPPNTIRTAGGRMINVPAPPPPGAPPIPRYSGEVVSPRSPNLLTPETYATWVRNVYPHHVNGTCGLHVHMSFYHKLNYSRLMTPDFTPYMIEQLKAWGKKEGIPDGHMFWNRLDPAHPWTQRHCTHLFLGDKQATIRKKDYNSRGTDHSRYTFINYCASQHSTVECRGLPMFGGQPTTPADVETAIRAIGAVLDATNRFLSKVRQIERAVSVGVPARPSVSLEFGTTIR